MNCIPRFYRSDTKVKKWQTEKKQFGIVLDNIDVYVKPRRETAGKHNTMFHMVQAIAVQERIQPGREDQIPPIIRIDEVSPEHVLPTDTHIERLHELLVDQVLKIWKGMPQFSDAAIHTNSEEHRYTSKMKKKSTVVSVFILCASMQVSISVFTGYNGCIE